MKRLFIILNVLLLIMPALIAQSPAKYWIHFTDKKGTPYSVQNPERFLSPRAVELRVKHHIPIDTTDFPVNPEYVRRVLAVDSSVRLCAQSKWHNAITVYVSDEKIADAIRKLPFVQGVERTIVLPSSEDERNIVFQYKPVGRPRHTLYSDFVRHRDFAYGKSEEQIRLNNAHWLHRLGFHGEEMLMMVMDGGFRNVDTSMFFENLVRDNRLLGVHNFVHPSVNPFFLQNHGTAVLSCIASYLPGKLVGSAPMAMFYLCVTEDGDSENKIEEDNWVAGVELADSLGCQVLNSSLGYTTFDDSTQVRQYSDMNGKVSRASVAASIAASKGMIVCNSAGNEGGKKWTHIGAPADAEGILTVGAVTPEGNPTAFSSNGPAADGRVKPDVCAVGYGTWTGNSSGQIFQSSGTSFASPLMSGMVACLWQAFPDKSNFEIMDAVRKSCNQYSTPNTHTGYGVPDFLSAYNRLNQSDFKGYEKVRFDSFVAENNVLHFSVEAREMPVLSFESDGKLLSKTKVDVEQVGSLYNFKVTFPKLKLKNSYRLIDCNVLHNGTTHSFVVAQEKRLR